MYPHLSYRDLLVDERMADNHTAAARERQALRAVHARRRPRSARRLVSPLLVLRRITRLLPTP